MLPGKILAEHSLKIIDGRNRFGICPIPPTQNRLTNPYSDFLLKGIINTGGDGNPAAGRIGRKLVHQGFTAERPVPHTAPGLC